MTSNQTKFQDNCSHLDNSLTEKFRETFSNAYYKTKQKKGLTLTVVLLDKNKRSLGRYIFTKEKEWKWGSRATRAYGDMYDKLSYYKTIYSIYIHLTNGKRSSEKIIFKESK